MNFDKKAAILNLTVCIIVGGIFSYFTSVKWLAASFWIFAALFINGSLAFYEDARPGGFDNPTGSDTPAFARGVGAFKFWAVSVLVSASAVGIGAYVQFN